MMNKADTSIKEVKVSRNKLLTTLKQNLSRHRSDFETAVAGYQQARQERLALLAAEALAAAENPTEATRKTVHEAYREFAHLESPSDHSESYELAIEIMSWECEDEVTLSINDFQCYVRDRWTWREQFRNSVLNYASHGRTL